MPPSPSLPHRFAAMGLDVAFAFLAGCAAESPLGIGLALIAFGLWVGGLTVGMAATGLHLVTTDGQPVGFLRAVARIQLAAFGLAGGAAAIGAVGWAAWGGDLPDEAVGLAVAGALVGGASLAMIVARGLAPADAICGTRLVVRPRAAPEASMPVDPRTGLATDRVHADPFGMDRPPGDDDPRSPSP